MEDKRTKIFFGLLLVAVGALSILSHRINFRLFSTEGVAILLGAVLILSYITKRSSWALIFGGYLLYYGLASVLTRAIDYFFNYYPSSIYSAMFFIVPGIIFLILYYDKFKTYLLLPGSFLLWFGIYLLVGHLPIINQGSFFFIAIGAAFLTIYFLNYLHTNKMALYSGLVVMALGVMSYLRSPFIDGFFRRFRLFISAAVILIGIGIVIKTITESEE